MAIVKMKKLRLLCLSEERESLLKDLQLMGCVEVNDVGEELAAVPGGEDFRRCSAPLSDLRTTTAQLSSALAALDIYAPYRRGLFDPRPDMTAEQLFDDDVLTRAKEAAASIIALSAKVTAARSEEGRLRGELASLIPWKDLPFPLEMSSTKTTDIFLGTLPVGVEFGEAENALAAEEELCSLRLISTDKAVQYVALISHKSVTENALTVLRGCGFTRVLFPGRTGTAEENIALTEKAIADAEAAAAAAADAIAALAGERDGLQLSAERINQDITRAETAENIYVSGSVFALEGWFPAEDLNKLSALLDKYTCTWETSDPAPEEYDNVPVKLKSNKLTSPYNVVTEMYSLPAYNGLDPNPFIMPFFALFFGIMFADMAYGLLMFIAGFAALKLMKPKGTMKNMMGLLVQCGISTFVIGFFTGGFFGDAVSVVGGIFGKEWTLIPTFGTIRIGDAIAIDLPLNLLEGNNPLYVLVLAMVIGVVHLAFAVGIGVYLKIKDKDWLGVVADLSWWVIFAGIAVMILANSKVVLFVGIGLMVGSAFLQGKGLGRLTGIFGAVYNGLTGYLGDILSYSRLMALMLAGSVIASVFNQLGSLGGIFLFIPVFLIGHVLNFALNLIGCFVHTMRLQFLEFFGKWYRDGGKPFNPLNYNTKYIDIKED